MIPSFHAVFCLRQWDKSAKVIDYKDMTLKAHQLGETVRKL